MSELPYDSLQERKAKVNADASNAYQVQNGSIHLFLDKLKEWRFNMPSNNLWTIEIQLHNDGSNEKHTLLQLYQNIEKANSRYNSINGTNWKVITSGNGSFGNDFLNRLQTDKTAFFLAQGISYDTRQVSLNDNSSDFMAQESGFLKFGTIENGVNYSPTARVQFLETNWSLGDVLFDKWIAAIGQQGLIEDSSLPNIKSDIFLYQYAASIPSELTNKKSSNKYDWQLRKITKLIKAFPRARSGTTDINYENNGPKIETVEFSFMDYQIEYSI